jgi:hypothetical protein
LTARLERDRLLDDVVGEATVDGKLHPSPLTLPEIRSLLAERLQGRPTRANFRTGQAAPDQSFGGLLVRVRATPGVFALAVSGAPGAHRVAVGLFTPRGESRALGRRAREIDHEMPFPAGRAELLAV